MTLRYGAVVWSLRSLRGGPDDRRGQARRRPRCRIARTRAAGSLRSPISTCPRGRPARRSLLVHGGGFVIGSRRMKPMRYLAARLDRGGHRGVHRRLPDDLPRWPARRGGRRRPRRARVLVRARARARARSRARSRWSGCPRARSLALLVAARDRCARRRSCACFGLYEVDHLRGPATLLPRLLFGTADRAAWTARSPRHAPQPAVPTLLLHGSDDGLVPVDQARRLAAHREALGLPTRLVIYHGAPHGFFNLPVPAADAGVREIIAHVGGSTA